MSGAEEDFTKEFDGKVRLVNKIIRQILSKRGLISSELQMPVRYALEGPGKRIRPAIVLWCCELVAGKVNRDAQIAASAIEMVHTYSLIHDDLPAMDDDDYRRGRLTCHRKFDEATAILTGDALLTLAFELLAKEINEPKTAVKLIIELAGAAGPAGMVAGQLADLKAAHLPQTRFIGISHSPDLSGLATEDTEVTEIEKKKADGGVNPALLKNIHTNKTAKMFRCAAAMGGICGGADGLKLKALRSYGLKIGLGFQIADDVLDVSATSAQLGKTSGKDARQGKATYPAIVGLAKSRRLAETLANEAIMVLRPFGKRAGALRRLAGALLKRTR